ncbi:hypothetical protein FF38_08559 [Lucilia cuprina]|uniref:Uncharacterized protein n=1 Tax=Lucilia cuprina TaxID=7375 RepID=A0A0L0CCE7_LUCCU|nr:hypothetical protein FF38_08559 [Lucilia cuprina]
MVTKTQCDKLSMLRVNSNALSHSQLPLFPYDLRLVCPVGEKHNISGNTAHAVFVVTANKQTMFNFNVIYHPIAETLLSSSSICGICGQLDTLNRITFLRRRNRLPSPAKRNIGPNIDTWQPFRNGQQVKYPFIQSCNLSGSMQQHVFFYNIVRQEERYVDLYASVAAIKHDLMSSSFHLLWSSIA